MGCDHVEGSLFRDCWQNPPLSPRKVPLNFYTRGRVEKPSLDYFAHQRVSYYFPRVCHVAFSYDTIERDNFIWTELGQFRVIARPLEFLRVEIEKFDTKVAAKVPLRKVSLKVLQTISIKFSKR